MDSDLSGRRILVVEDEALVAWDIEAMLTEFGCTVVGPAARVNQALEIIELETIDAVILDINLGGEKSYPVADALATRQIPFVFATAYNRNALPTNYLKFLTLQKPLERSKLDSALTELFSPGIPRSTEEKPCSSSVWDANRLRIATDAAGVALWSWNVDNDLIELDELAHHIWGVPSGPVTFGDLSAHIHPEDLDRVRAAFAGTRELVGTYEVDFRILHGTAVRWISARGKGGDEGIVGRVMFGVFLDVTERKMVEEGREMLAGEMGHRVKNLFAIAAALATISARATTTSKEMSHDLRQRLTALSRAHDLVRPIMSEPKKAVQLATLLAVLLAPYSETGATGERVQISVPDVLVGESSCTTIALIVHELATNAVKYGALSSEAGTVSITCAASETAVVLTWRELGGPVVPAPSRPSGFGSQLIRTSIAGNLGGTIDYEWPAEGAIITLCLSLARLGA